VLRMVSRFEKQVERDSKIEACSCSDGISLNQYQIADDVVQLFRPKHFKLVWMFGTVRFLSPSSTFLPNEGKMVLGLGRRR
jgi:hypothetical protein